MREVIREVVVETVETLHVGPIASPETLAGYSRVVENGAERAFAMSEREQASRHWMGKSYVYFRFVGLASALILALTALIGGIYLVASDKQVAGIALLIGE